MDEATKFHPNNQGLPAQGVPADIDQLVFEQRNSERCDSVQCGKIAMGEEGQGCGKEAEELVVAGCGKNVPAVTNYDSVLTSSIQTKINSSSQNALFSPSKYFSKSNTAATNDMPATYRAVLRDKLSKKVPTLKNADLDRAVDDSAETVKEAAYQVKVTGQMRGAGRQARVVVGRGRSKNLILVQAACVRHT